RLQARARTETGDARIAEVSNEEARTIELEGDVDRRIVVQHPEAGWKHADDLVRDAVQRQRTPDNVVRAVQPGLPVRPAHDHRLRRAGLIIGRAEETAAGRTGSQ